MALARARRERGMDYWPGFVDALSTLILAIIFMPVMAVEMAAGFALVVAVFRRRPADTTQSLTTLRH